MSSKRNKKQQAVPASQPRMLPALLLLIPLAVVVVYANAMKAPFAYDDRIHIIEDPRVASFRSAFDWTALAKSFDTPAGWQGRPLLVGTYGSNYAAWGADPQAFRQVNVLIHVVNALLVFAIVFELGALLNLETARRWSCSLVAAGFFACHPLLTESVTYITGRSSSLCALFYFAGLYATVRAGRASRPARRLLLLATIICTVVGLLVKQEAITLPAASIALVWLAWPSNASFRRRLNNTAAFAGVTVLILALQLKPIREVSTATQKNYELVAAGFETTLPFKSYVLTATRAFAGYYLWRFFLPVKLNIDPEVPTVTSWISPGAWLSAVILLGAACAALWLRRRRPLVSFGIALVLISPLSAYCVFPLADVVAEHRAYITILGVVIVLADCVMAIRWPFVIASIVLAMYGWLTIERNTLWVDEVLLWEDARRQTPEKIRPHVNLGALYQAKGQFDRAISEYEFVLSRDPDHSGALSNLGSIYLDSGNLDRAEQLLKRAIDRNTAFAPVYLNMGVVRLRQGRFKEARELLVRSASLNPRQRMVHLNLGDIFYNEGQPAKAIPEYLMEIELNPGLVIAHLHLAMAYEAVGQREQSLQAYLAVVRYDPGNADAAKAIQRLQ